MTNPPEVPDERERAYRVQVALEGALPHVIALGEALQRLGEALAAALPQMEIASPSTGIQCDHVSPELGLRCVLSRHPAGPGWPGDNGHIYG